MDAEHFDLLARALHRRRSRRLALRLLASSALGAQAASLGLTEGTATHFECRHVGEGCRRDRQCCSGRCRKKQCKGHDAGICQLEQDVCRQGFDTLCGGTCACRGTTGNAAFCGDGGGQCRNCVRDKECEADFGRGAACVDISCISPGCGPAGGNTGGKMCMPRCADPD
jgi:hypothetical protein